MCSIHNAIQISNEISHKNHHSTSCFFFFRSLSHAKKALNCFFSTNCFFIVIRFTFCTSYSFQFRRIAPQIESSVCVHWLFNLVTDSLESHKHFFYCPSLCLALLPFHSLSVSMSFRHTEQQHVVSDTINECVFNFGRWSEWKNPHIEHMCTCEWVNARVPLDDNLFRCNRKIRRRKRHTHMNSWEFSRLLDN